MLDYRELVIADLADENALLGERVAGLEADVAVYRQLATAALDAVRDLTVGNRALVIAKARTRQDVLDELHAAQGAAIQQSEADDMAAA